MSSRRQLTRVLGVGMDYGIWAGLQHERIVYVNAHRHTKFRAAATLTGKAGQERKRAIATIGGGLCAGGRVLVALGGRPLALGSTFGRPSGEAEIVAVCVAGSTVLRTASR